MRNTVVCVYDSTTATIANGASLSGAVALGGLRLFGLCMPDTWTTAAITFQVSCDGGTTWKNLYDANGNEVTVQAAASRAISLFPLYQVFAHVTHIKLRSGTSGTAVNQGGDRTITLELRAI